MGVGVPEGRRKIAPMLAADVTDSLRPAAKDEAAALPWRSGP